jgi:hypothetical protein
MNRLQTFLQLTPEFGGTRFGPFPGPEIRLGSDPSKNDITLPEALGVLPEHVKILIQSDGSYIVAPTERTAAVHVFRGGQRPRHIATATALAAGDSFALVTADGPRFVVVAEEPPRPEKKKQTAMSKMVPSKEGLWAELKRLGFAMFFRNRIGNTIQRVWMLVKTGTIFTPRYIIAFLMMGTGAFTAIAAAIGGILAWFTIQDRNDQIEERERDLAECRGDAGQTEDPTLPQLTMGILVDDEWGPSLEVDEAFRTAFLDRLRTVLQRREDYAWVYKSNSGMFRDLKRASERTWENEMASFARVFPYVAATPGSIHRDAMFVLLPESTRPDKQCARGPARMTYMQAVNFGVVSFPTVIVNATTATSSTEEELRTAILGSPGVTPEARAALEGGATEILNATVGSQSSAFACVYPAGTDDREVANDVVRALDDDLGKRGAALPDPGSDFWITARLMKYYAGDLDYGYADLNFAGGPRRPPSTALDGDAVNAQAREFIIGRAAETAARAVAIPCLGQLDKENREAATELLGELPSVYRCLYLNYLATGDT